MPFTGEEEEDPPVHAQRVTITSAEDLSEITSQIGSLPCDYWWEKEGAWVRVHVHPRRAMFTPMGTVGGPDPENLSCGRHTEMVFEDGERREIDDEWHTEGEYRVMDRAWTGLTFSGWLNLPRSRQSRPPLAK